MPVPLPRTALAGQPRRLVQCDDMLVLPDHRFLDHLGIGIADPGFGLLHGGGIGQGRNAHLLPRFDPGIRLDPAAIDADLAGPAHLFDRAMRHLREFLP